LPGDGIGPEVVAQGTRALLAVADSFGHQFDLREATIGGVAIDQTGAPLPPSTLDLCQSADAVLLGAVGGPKWSAESSLRPEQALLELRKALGLFANIRPVLPHRRVLGASTLKPEVLRKVDLVIVRELTGGLYFGEKRGDAERAVDTCVYTRSEIARVVRVACQLARGRRRKLTSVDKANVLETSRLWRSVCTQVVRDEFPDVHLDHMLVDNCAMQLVARPSQFDVIVTENMFGDILSDEASVLCGSIGLLPSASLGEGPRGLYEPIHGSAPDIAGFGVANPYGTIMSVALLLRHSLGLEREAQALEIAICEALDLGAFTGDLAPEDHSAVSTKEAGSAVLATLLEAREHWEFKDAS
jgi:3-isopropylmalate dehydrogenase